MTIHYTDPFADPPEARDPVRRFRARVPAPVTVWTAGAGPERAGVTLSSAVVVTGAPAYALGVVADTAEFLDAARATGRFVVHVLGAGDEALADRFAGVLPAPGGRFRGLDVRQGEWGPELAAAPDVARCRLVAAESLGEAVLVRGEVDDVGFGPPRPALVHVRGRYGTVGPDPLT